MKTIESDIVIIGAGLTGLALAYYLKRTEQSVLLLEARNRVGGRIFTQQREDLAPLEMGATWLHKPNAHLLSLLADLNIGTFEQLIGDTAIYQFSSSKPAQLIQMPPSSEPSLRVKGGTDTIIEKLKSYLSPEQILLNTPVDSISEEGDSLLITSGEERFKAKKVVSTLPPNLFHFKIEVTPSLPSALTSIMKKTHTWMGESIKIGLRYASPFWRTEGRTGTIYSNSGPITEFYDHASHEDDRFGLIGFLNPQLGTLSREQRLSAILSQLKGYYGTVVDDYLSYEEVVWFQEEHTYAPYENGGLVPHQNNGSQVYRTPYLNGKLFIGGTETAPHFPGYMEGAISSAYTVFQEIGD